MNKLKRNPTESDLSAAIDKTVEAAVALGVSTDQLVSQLSQRVQQTEQIAKNNVLQLRAESRKKMYCPDAGP